MSFEELPAGSGAFASLFGPDPVNLIGVVILIAMIPAIIAGGALDQYLDIEVSATLLIVLLFVLLIAVMVLVIIYYAKVLSIYTAGKDMATLGTTTAKVSTFVIVINFLGLIFQLGGVVMQVFTLNFLAAASAFLGFLGTLLLTIVLALSAAISGMTVMTQSL